MRIVGENREMRIVNDQFGSLTAAFLLADVTAKIWWQISSVESEDRFGLYNISSSGVTSWCDYARYVVGVAEELGLLPYGRKDLIVPIDSCFFNSLTRRPKNV